VDMPTSQAKPFDIPKQMVWEAYRRVAANKGALGVDEVDLGEFEADLKNNLYLLTEQLAREALPVLFIPTLRRRRRRALCDQASGRAGASGDLRTDGGGRPQAAPGQDVDRLLQ